MNARTAFLLTALAMLSTPVSSQQNPATASVTGRWVACVDNEVLGPTQYVLLLGAEGEELIGVLATIRIGVPPDRTGRDGIRNSAEFRFQYVINDDNSLSFSHSLSGAITGTHDYTAEIDGDSLTLTTRTNTRISGNVGEILERRVPGRSRSNNSTVTTYTRSTANCPL